ncbi:MAG: hypothetical protein V3V28_13335 [Polaribacter sp.]|uniref:hypothetical protein n=1 Tax=Polaribacter sp. TaxID=1920175 RepID=UPI002F352123
MSQDITYYFNSEVFYSMKRYVSISDASECTYNCPLNPVPNDFKIEVKIHYDSSDEMLVMENVEEISCGIHLILSLNKLLIILKIN